MQNFDNLHEVGSIGGKISRTHKRAVRHCFIEEEKFVYNKLRTEKT
jgi:hypothetical protein